MSGTGVPAAVRYRDVLGQRRGRRQLRQKNKGARPARPAPSLIATGSCSAPDRGPSPSPPPISGRAATDSYPPAESKKKSASQRTACHIRQKAAHAQCRRWQGRALSYSQRLRLGLGEVLGSPLPGPRRSRVLVKDLEIDQPSNVDFCDSVMWTFASRSSESRRLSAAPGAWMASGSARAHPHLLSRLDTQPVQD